MSPQEETGFLDHLEVLRRKILLSAAVVVAAAGISLIFAGRLVDILEIPMRGLDVSLVYLKPQEKLVTYLRVGLFTGLLIGIPFLIIEIASFVVPGLTRRERFWFLPTVAVVLILFAGGTAFGFFFLTPFALRFLAGFATEETLLPLWSIGGYVQFVVSVVLVCGVLFLLPLLLFFLFAAELLSVETAAGARKYVLLGIFLAAAFLTPPDIFTQVSVGLLLYALFEITLVAGRLFRRKRGGGDG
jgi:sec-independent protein translocase protein TatC